jgi:hypothetical protein
VLTAVFYFSAGTIVSSAGNGEKDLETAMTQGINRKCKNRFRVKYLAVGVKLIVCQPVRRVCQNRNTGSLPKLSDTSDDDMVMIATMMYGKEVCLTRNGPQHVECRRDGADDDDEACKCLARLLGAPRGTA